MAFGLSFDRFAPQFETGNGDPASGWRGRELFDRNAVGMYAAARKDVEVADLVDLAQVRGFNPRSSQRYASNGIEFQPAAVAEGNFILVVVRRRAFGLIPDQQRAVSQLDQRTHAMKAGNDRGEPDVRSSSEVEVVIPVAQRETTRLFAQSKEGPGKIRALADSNDDVLAVTIEVDIHVGCCDRVLAQRQPRL